MSKVIDEKVVEMRFDNSNFERNTRETMSTLDKLKQKLKFDGASKGLEQINVSANKVNFDGMCKALDSASNKFSALQVMGITALANITNSAVNAGKQLVKSLSVDQITSGWNKMNQKLGSVQTLVNSTGLSVDEIDKYLQKLMWFSDETNYSFTDMTSALAQMTSTGGDIKKLVPMITGIANATAYAGKGAAEFSRAIFNLNQSYGGGYLTLMDWRSLQGAGVNSKQLTQTLIDVGVELGKIKKGTVTVGNFTDTLKDKWADTEVMEKAFSKFSALSEAAYKAVDAGEYTTASEAIEALSKNFDELAVRSFASAQEAKTFKEAIDSVKEAMGSGFMRIFEDIFGNYEQQKKLWTDLANTLYDIFVEPINKIHERVSTALKYNPFTALMDKLKNSEIGQFAKKVENLSKSLEYYQTMVTKVWRGDYKNQPVRSKLMEADGHNYKVIQSLVNKGYKYKLTVDDVRAAEEKYGITAKETADAIEEVTDAKLKDIGLTDDEIKMYRELEQQSKDTGKSIEEIIAAMEKKDGRTLLIEGFQNIGNAIITIFNAIKDAWSQVFPPMSAIQLYNIIDGFNKFTSKLIMSEDTVDKLTRTLRGLFSILGFIKDILGGGLKIAFAILKEVLKLCGYGVDNILDLTAAIGDAIYNARQWIKENSILADGIKIVAQLIKAAAEALVTWIKNNERIQNGFAKFKSKLEEISKAIKDWASGIKEADNIPKYILSGLVNGLKNGASMAVNAIINLGKKLIDGICKVLGIHSPSVEFFKIGKYIIEGLINGIQNGLSILYNFIKNIGLKCIEIFKSIDFGKLLAAGIGIGLIVVVKDIVDTINSLSKLAYRVTAPLQGLGNLLSGIGNYFTDKGEAAKIESYGKAVRNMALSIVMIAGAILIISKIPKEDLWRSVGVVAGIVVAVGALYALIALLNKNNKGLGSADKNNKTVLGLIGIAGSLFLMALAMKKLSTIGIESTKNAIINLTAIVIALGVLMWTIGKCIDTSKEYDMTKVAKLISKVAKALLILILAVKLASMLKTEEIAKGLTVVTAFGALITGLMWASKLAGESADKAGKMISKVAWSLLIMVGVVKLAAMLKPEEIAKGIGFITGVGVFFAALIAVSHLAGANASKAGAMMLMMSLALGIMVIVIKQISSLDPSEMSKGLKAISLLGLVFAALIAVSHLAGKNAIKAGAMLLMVSGALLILTGVLFILSKIDTDGLVKALGIITILETLFAGLIYVTKYSQNCVKTIVAIIVSITILIAALIGLSFIDSSKLATAAASITAIMSALALIIASTKLIGNPKDLALSLASIVTAVGLLALILALMSNLENPQAALIASGAISLLLVAMSASFAIISKTGPLAKKSILSIAAMELAIAGLAGILGVMAYFKIEPSIKTAVALSVLLLAMSGALVILSAVGPVADKAMIGALALDGFILILGGLIAGLGALVTKFPQLEEFLNKGIPILEKIGYGLGAFVGNIIAGFAGGVSNALPVIGQNLSNFMTNVSGFIEGAKSIDESVIKGIGYLSGAIIALAGAELLSAITSFLSGDFSLGNFGTELSTFMTNASGFITGITSVDPKVAEGAKNLADAILSITNANLVETLTSWLSGDSSLSGFGSQLGQLGTDLASFVTNLGTFGEDQLKAVDCAGRAIKALSEAANQIPGTDGLWQKVFGEQSLATFGGQLPGLASNLASFVTNLGTFTDAQVTTVDCAGKAITTLGKAAENIPSTDGLWQKVFGEKSISKFSGDLPGLGTNLAAFVTNLGTFTDAQVTTVNCASNAISALANAADGLPSSDGFWQKMFGEKSLATFGGQLPGLAENISSFVQKLGTFSNDQVTTVNSACNAIRSIARLGEINIKDTGKNLKTFGGNMVDFAKKVKDFVDKIGNVGSDGISSAITKVKELIEVANTVASANSDAVKNFGESLKKLAKDGVNGFVNELSSKSAKSDAKSAAEGLINSVIDGADSKKDSAKDAFKAVAEEAVNALSSDTLKSDAEGAGKDLAQGLINGLQNEDKKNAVYNAAYKLGQLAVQGEKDGQQSASPSKATIKAGKWLGEGLIIGIQKIGSKVYTAGSEIGQQATNSISNAVNTALSLLNSDSDMQPTIRPVLDLSDVESGAGYLNSMFNAQSIGVSSNLSAISYGMKEKLQNESNNDVVSAINRLGSNLGNNGDTYNINGITYNDESNITEAVKVLIRAANIERRK